MNFKSKVWLIAYRDIDLKDAVLKIKDGGSNNLTVKMGEGTLTYTVRRNIAYKKERGLLSGGSVQEGDEEPCEVRFDGRWEYITGTGSGGTPTIEDALYKQGAASAWESTDADDCAPFALDLELTYTPDSNADCVDDVETITFSDFRYEQVDHDAKAATISVSGHCNEVRPTPVRTSGS